MTVEKTRPAPGAYVPLDRLAPRAHERLVEPDVEAELARFEAEERARLGLADEGRAPYVERVASGFTKAERPRVTMLVGGLTMAHDFLIAGALARLGYRMQPLDVPDTDALRVGKEYGSRGQCNPTWFTVGNLVKHLMWLRDVQGLATEEILRDYVFLTAGACGPCRFGMYVTEYRKALRDAGFDGFRVVLFQQQGGLKQATGEEVGLELTPPFFLAILKAILAGDAINAIGYRLRPYELEEGATDRAVEEAKVLVRDALRDGRSLAVALLRARRAFARVRVDRLRVKPKVAIIGEFWAMTTEGDGSYRMQQFLQREGAEVDVQLVTAWILFMIWENARDTRHRMTLREDDAGRKGLAGKDVRKKLALLWVADKALRATFQAIANAAGLHGYVLPDMDEVADTARDFYNNDLRGGEAHMEVAKLILNVLHSKVNMTLSIKPFGCMPSSAVSDGVQSAITELYPEAIFLPVETSGDGEVNVHSRVQMMLFKARQAAEREVAEACERWGTTVDEARETLARVPLLGRALTKAPHVYGSTAADMVALAGAARRPWRALRARA